MGKFDFLRIRDSDSDSSEEPAQQASPSNGSVTAVGRGEVSPHHEAESVSEKEASTRPIVQTLQVPQTLNPAQPSVESSAGGFASKAAFSPEADIVPAASVSPASAGEKPATSPDTSISHEESPREAATPDEQEKAQANGSSLSAGESDDGSYSYSYSYSASGSGSHAQTSSGESEQDRDDEAPAAMRPQAAADAAAGTGASADAQGDGRTHSTVLPKRDHGNSGAFPTKIADDNTSGGFSDELSPHSFRDDGPSSEASAGPSPGADVTIHGASPLRGVNGDVMPALNQADNAQNGAVATAAVLTPPRKKTSLFSCLCCGRGNADETESDAEEDAHRIAVEPEVHRLATQRSSGQPSVHMGDSPHPERASALAAGVSSASLRSSHAGGAREVPVSDNGAGEEGADLESPHRAAGEEVMKGESAEPGDTLHASESVPPRESQPAEGTPAAKVMADSPEAAAAVTPVPFEEAATSVSEKDNAKATPASERSAASIQETPKSVSAGVFAEEDHSPHSLSNDFQILEESPAERLTPHDYRTSNSREAHHSASPQANRAADPYSHLPLYQRRILLDQRARERREAEELAREWKDLTFHPNLYKLTGGAVEGRRASPPTSSTHRQKPSATQYRPSFSTSPPRHRPEADATKEFNDNWYGAHHSLFVDLDGDDDGVLTTHLGAKNVQAMRTGSARLPSRPSARLPARRFNETESHEPLSDMPPSKTFGADGGDADDDGAFTVRTPPRRMTKTKQNELFTRLLGHHTATSASRSVTPKQTPRQSTQATPRTSLASPRRPLRPKGTQDEDDENVFSRLYNLSKSPRRVSQATPEKEYSFHPQVTDLARQQASSTHHRSVVDRLYPGSPRKEQRPAMKVEALLSGSTATRSEPAKSGKSAFQDPVAMTTKPVQKTISAADSGNGCGALSDRSQTVTSTTHSNTDTEDQESTHSTITHTETSDSERSMEEAEEEKGSTPLPPTICT